MAPTSATLPCKYGVIGEGLQGPEKSLQIPSPLRWESLYRFCVAQPTHARNRRSMNAPSELNFEEMLRIRLEVLRREHRDLDEAVHVLETAGRPDPLTLRRLKKQKLALKDQIVRIEDQLIPNIIA
jgi:hypothetical protein